MGCESGLSVRFLQFTIELGRLRGVRFPPLHQGLSVAALFYFKLSLLRLRGWRDTPVDLLHEGRRPRARPRLSLMIDCFCDESFHLKVGCVEEVAMYIDGQGINGICTR